MAKPNRVLHALPALQSFSALFCLPKSYPARYFVPPQVRHCTSDTPGWGRIVPGRYVGYVARVVPVVLVDVAERVDVDVMTGVHLLPDKIWPLYGKATK